MSRKIFFHRVLNRGRRACPACFLCYFLHAAKSNNPFPLGNFLTSRKFAPVGAARRACKGVSRFCKPRISAPQWRFRTGRFAAFPGGRAARTFPVGNISPAFEKAEQNTGRRGAAPYLYTQSVCAACFASILRRTSRRLGVPGRDHFPAFEKAGQNTDSTPGVLFYGCPEFCGSCRTA